MAERTRQTFCQEHLDQGQRQDIAQGLYVVKQHYEGRNELHGLCPFHEDGNPSFSYNYVKDVYGCQGCSATGDLIDLWCHKEGRDRKEGGFKAFCEAFGLNTRSKAGTKKPVKGQSAKPKKGDVPSGDVIDESGWTQARIPVESAPAKEPEKPKEEPSIPEEVWAEFPPLPDDIIEELVKRRSWTKEGIERAGLRMYVHTKEHAKLRRLPFGEKRVAIPVRDEDGILRNIRLYSPFGTREGYPKICSWGQGYGSARLLPSPSSWGTGPLWYCEGEPDWICAISQGLNAMTKTSGAKIHKKEWNRHFRGRDVIFCYDADKTGLAGAEKGAVLLSREAESVRVVMWPRFMYLDNPAPKHDGKSDFTPFVMSAGEEYPQDHGEDLTDFITKYGKSVRDLRDLLPSARSFARPKGDDAEIGGAARFFGGARGTTFKPVLLAEAFLKDHEIVTDPTTQKPFLWNSRHYEEYEIQHIRSATTRMLEKEAKTNYVNDATSIILNLSSLEHGRKFNDKPEWVCLKNGMLNLETGEMVPHARDYCSTYQLGVSFDPNDEDPECPDCKGTPGHVDCDLCWGRGRIYRCERWIQFLRETIQVRETIMQIQEFFGLCLTRETRFAKCLLMIGPGSDGKSTLLDVLQALIGEENCSAVSMSDLEKEFYRASLYNKALNVSAEFDSGAFHSDWFKRLVTGDMVSASFKHRDFFEFRFWGKMAFAANRYPKALDNTDGFFRRLLVVKFKRQFLRKEDRDLFLKEKLAKELDWVFGWALDGLERLWRQQDFTESADSAEALMEYKRTNNPVLIFFEEKLLYRPLNGELRLAKDVAYKAYCKFCTEWGFTSGSRVHFGRELRIVLPSLADGRLLTADRDKCYMGLTLADSEEAARVLRDEAAASSSPSPSTGRVPHNNEGS
jgi:putative DNA primase/helicase